MFVNYWSSLHRISSKWKVLQIICFWFPFNVILFITKPTVKASRWITFHDLPYWPHWRPVQWIITWCVKVVNIDWYCFISDFRKWPLYLCEHFGVVLISYCVASQNDQTHFKNLAANATRFLKCDHFWMLYI